MFKKWLNENDVKNFDYSGIIYEKASNREFWDEKYSEVYIKNAEKYLNFNWPIIRATDYIAFRNDGDRVKQQTPHNAKRIALIALVIGEVLEYKGRFIPDIVDGLLNTCEETFWGISAHYQHSVHPKLPFGEHYIDLDAAETGALIAITLYLLRDELNNYWPNIVEHMEYELDNRIIKPYLKYNDFCWMTGPRQNNWNPWIISNIATVLFLYQERNEDFFKVIEKMLNQIQIIYDTYFADGGCDEGASYWFHSGVTIIDFCHSFYSATNGKINFLSNQKIKNIGTYICKAYIGKGMCVNFADGSNKLFGSPDIYACGKYIGSQEMMSLSKEIYEINSVNLDYPHIKEPLRNVLFSNEIKEQPDISMFEESILPDIENAFFRSDKWYCAAKGGNNYEGHNHNDVGSFIVYYDNEPLLVDPGVGVYTKKTFSPERYTIWTMRSDWHNLPVINGKVQCNGPEFKTDSFSLENKVCNISFANAYTNDANVSSVKRKLILSDNGLEIIDDFIFSLPQNTVSEHFITPYDVEITEKGAVINNEFIISSTEKADICVEEHIFDEEDAPMKANWKSDSIKRIIFKYKFKEKANVSFKLIK